MCLRHEEIDGRVSARTEKDALDALPVRWLVLSSFYSHLDHCSLNQGLVGLPVMSLVVA